MSAAEPEVGRSNLIQRVKNILLRPGETWEVIDREPATVGSLYKGYVAPLAAIPAVCGLIGVVIFGYGALGVTYKPPILSAVAWAIVSYVLSLLMVFVMALIIDALAPTFGGTRNRVQALKVAAYSMTAAWVVGVFSIIPMLSILGLLGLYGIYLLFKGLPPVMKAPEDKAGAYTVVVLLVAIVLTVIISAISAPIMRMSGPAGPFADRGASGELRIGDTRVDLGQLEAASKQMEAAARQMESGQTGEGVQPTSVEALEGFLPQSVGGFSRTEVSTSSGGVGGLTGSMAEGVYTRGDARFTLTVTDMGAAGALAGMANAFNVQSSSDNGGRYEKVGRVDGRMTMEEYDRNTGQGSYGVLVADRFMVQAEGEGASIEELKGAVGAVNPGRLEQLAKAG